MSAPFKDRSLHLALAEASMADYFCTCDDQLVRKSKGMVNLQVRITSPLDLVQEIEK
jgi:predicted nucleic acid-binding protein